MHQVQADDLNNRLLLVIRLLIFFQLLLNGSNLSQLLLSRLEHRFAVRIAVFDLVVLVLLEFPGLGQSEGFDGGLIIFFILELERAKSRRWAEV
jgi:hypothetical protein